MYDKYVECRINTILYYFYYPFFYFVTSLTPQSQDGMAEERLQWLPGDYIPQDEGNLPGIEFRLMSSIQKIEEKLDVVWSKLDSMESRVSKLEQNSQLLASCSASGSTCSSSSEANDNKRSRRSPPELQVSFNMIYK